MEKGYKINLSINDEGKHQADVTLHLDDIDKSINFSVTADDFSSLTKEILNKQKFIISQIENCNDAEEKVENVESLKEQLDAAKLECKNLQHDVAYLTLQNNVLRRENAALRKRLHNMEKENNIKNENYLEDFIDNLYNYACKSIE